MQRWGKISFGNGFYLTPEVRLGTGTGDDTVSIPANTDGISGSVNAEIDSFSALSLRAQYEFDNGIYLFAAPTYFDLDITATADAFFISNPQISATESSSISVSKLGFGAGAGYNFNDTISADIMYENLDDDDAISVGLKMHF